MTHYQSLTSWAKTSDCYDQPLVYDQILLTSIKKEVPLKQHLEVYIAALVSSYLNLLMIELKKVKMNDVETLLCLRAPAKINLTIRESTS